MTLERTKVVRHAAVCRSWEKGRTDGEGVSMPQGHHLPSSVRSGRAGVCEQEACTGLRSICTMNRFSFTTSSCSLVWGLQGKYETVLKGVGGSFCAECHLPSILPPQAQLLRLWRDGSEWAVSHGSAVAADWPYVLLANQLQGNMCWLKLPSWLQYGEGSSNIRYINTQDWRPLGFPLGNSSHSVAWGFLRCVIDFIKGIAALFWVLPSRPPSFKQYTALL